MARVSGDRRRIEPLLMARAGWQRRLEKYFSNPMVKVALHLGVAPKSFALLETIGRRSGRARHTAVGNGLDGEVFWLVSEHGPNSSYAKNLAADPHVRIQIGRYWRQGTATFIPEDDPWARRQRIDSRNGLLGRADGIIFRAAATQPVSIRIDLDTPDPGIGE